MTWSEVIRDHTTLAGRCYAPRLGELSARCGFRVNPDGSNGAKSREDVDLYLNAVKELFGQVAFTSARLMISNNLRKMG